MSDVMARVMGGPTKAEAREIIRRLTKNPETLLIGPGMRKRTAQLVRKLRKIGYRPTLTRYAPVSKKRLGPAYGVQWNRKKVGGGNPVYFAGSRKLAKRTVRELKGQGKTRVKMSAVRSPFGKAGKHVPIGYRIETNPRRRPTLIYNRIKDIYADGHATEPGRFRHHFTGQHKVYGLPNGDVLVTSRRL